jgi:hypothetical protein
MIRNIYFINHFNTHVIIKGGEISMNKILVALVCACFVLTAKGFAQTPPPDQPAPAAAPVATVKPMHHEHHPELHRAMRKLRGAKADLEKAASDFGGHKAKAIAAINAALEELHQAINYSDSK